jgi:hypothetical protein
MGCRYLADRPGLATFHGKMAIALELLSTNLMIFTLVKYRISATLAQVFYRLTSTAPWGPGSGSIFQRLGFGSRFRRHSLLRSKDLPCPLARHGSVLHSSG